jgi:hypothetical protein
MPWLALLESPNKCSPRLIFFAARLDLLNERSEF